MTGNEGVVMGETDKPLDGYSLPNAERFGWAGFNKEPLQPDRLELLNRYVVGPSVLDAGCGSGAFVDHFSRRGLNVTGVDNHEFCLAAAAGRGFQGTFIKADLAERLPFLDKSFDTTYCCDVLEHVDDQAVLKELVRVTCKRIIFTVPQDGSIMYKYRLIFPTYQDPTHLRYYTRDSVQKLTELVSPASLKIFGEQPIDIQSVMKDYLRPSSHYKGISSVYKKLAGYLLARSPDPDLFMNWSVVLDLQN